MSNKQKIVPLSMMSIFDFFKEAWVSVMTIQNSPLRHIQILDPMAAHAMFQILAYMWSAIFALWISNILWFGISALGHALLIGGIFITAMVYREANKRSDKKPTDNVTSGRMFGGEHD